MDPVRRYGDTLALVTVTRTAAFPPTSPPMSLPAVRSLPAATDRPVFVVQAATAGVPAAAGATLLRLPEDIGRPAAVNRAIAGLDTEVGWVAVADPGVEWGEGALDALLAEAARRPRAAVLGPRLRRPSGALVASGGALPTWHDARRFPAGPAPDGPTGWLSGACLLLRRTAWDSVDGFDPRYPGCGSDPEPADVDLGDRLARAGWLVVGVPVAEAVVPPDGGHGIILESRKRALRRFVHDRHRAPARALMALARRD